MNKQLSLFIFSLFSFVLSFAQPAGSLDPSFGIGGKVVTSIGTGIDKAYGVAIQSDGKIVVAGYSTNSLTDKDFTVCRYLSNGNLDSLFGTNGMVTTDLQLGSADIAFGLAIQSDNKIVLAGSSDDGSNKNGALIRYLSTGVVDSTFGTNGIVITDFENNQQDEIKAIKINQLTGHIIVGGSSIISSSIGKPVIARYLQNGQLDVSFNSTGIKTLWIAVNDQNRIFSVEDLVVLPNGKITTTGWRKNVSTSISSEYWACRVLSNGNMDNSFSADGVISYSDGTGSSYGYGLLLNANQDLIIAGTRSYNGIYTYKYLKINQDGTIPGTSVSYAIAGGIEIAHAIAENTAGQYILAGSMGSTTTSNFGLIRIAASSALDVNFGTNGVVQTAFGTNTVNQCFDVAIQTDNKIVAVGFTGNDFAIARYLGDDIPDLSNFNLISPTNLATNQNFTNTTLDWSDAFGASYYEVLIDTTANFLTAQTYSPISSTINLNNLKHNKTYYWKVRANDGTNWGNYSAVWSFTTGTLNPLNLVSPSNNAINQLFTSLNLTWNANTFAANYQLQYDTLATFATASSLITTAATNYQLTNLLPNHDYYWHVKAINGANSGTWSTTWRFKTKTQSSIGIEEEENNQIVLFPNPTSEFTTIIVPTHFLQEKYEIINVNGQVIQQGIINNEQVVIQLPKTNDSIYFIRVKNEFTEKLLIK
ncbi:MAG: T9SS type A sorting domain-containing protein [Fluviicola sp.]|nr:T9SS type A sorting domain-containing protein [Fluviicola sp.]MBP6271264.1 T9SS type A sorting domain-containing protein [Fluviicola sp.]